MARKTEKGGKFRNVHCFYVEYGKKTEYHDNQKHPIDDLKNDKITEKLKKWEMHTERPGIWREN